MLYDLIAPSAVLAAVSDSDEKESVGALIATRDALAESDSEEGRQNDAVRYASMVSTALGVIRQTSLNALGQLDVTIATDATQGSIEAGVQSAQEALNQFSDEGERRWSAAEFAEELSDRGFPASLAQAHAQAFEALADPHAQAPEDILAAMEIHMDAETKRMSSASLYIGRKSAQKMAHADIQWASKNGALVSQTHISISYLH